ncbi:unnamed protein product, partial [Arabidopsis halleri]
DNQPPETLALALSETKSWQLAQVMETHEESEDKDTEEMEATQNTRGEITCQLDASWEGNDPLSGFGFVINSPIKLFGLRSINR